ncbi:MAG: pilus assembly PilX N-terminal domain-containing protein [Thermodesulfobacteriota bacterium]
MAGNKGPRSSRRKGPGEPAALKRRFGRTGGVSLVPVIIIMTIFALLATAALRSLVFELRSVSRGYLDLAAHTAAESGIELARGELLAGREDFSQAAGENETFQYGKQVFPGPAGLETRCTVQVFVHPDRVFFESRAEIWKGDQVAARATVKTLYNIGGPPTLMSPAWRVLE